MIPATWADYATALAAVQAGHADGISYILTKDDPFGAIDLDHCRCTITHRSTYGRRTFCTAVNSYQEVTPSGDGVRIWGLANGAELHRKFTLEIDGKPIAAELFRRTNKALTITGYTLDPAVHELANIDKVFNWAVVWGERRKAGAATARVNDGNGFAGADRCPYTIDQIEHIVREGHPEGTDRSAVFHSIVGHYVGCGWDEQGYLRTYSNTRRGSAGAICVKTVSTKRLSGVPANMPSRSCRCRQVTAAGPAGKLRRLRGRSSIRNRRRRRSRTTSIRSSKTMI